MLRLTDENLVCNVRSADRRIQGYPSEPPKYNLVLRFGQGDHQLQNKSYASIGQKMPYYTYETKALVMSALLGW